METKKFNNTFELADYMYEEFKAGRGVTFFTDYYGASKLLGDLLIYSEIKPYYLELESVEISNYDDIYSAYKNPSVYKVRAWNWCKELCREMHGYDLIISAAGCQTFSVVFTFNERGTGRKCYAYITRDYNRFCYAEDVQQEEKAVMQMTAA